MRAVVTVLAVLAFGAEAAGVALLFAQVAGDRRSARQALAVRGQWPATLERALQTVNTSVDGLQAIDDLAALKTFLSAWMAGGARRTAAGALLAGTGAGLGLAATLVAIWG